MAVPKTVGVGASLGSDDGCSLMSSTRDGSSDFGASEGLVVTREVDGEGEGAFVLSVQFCDGFVLPGTREGSTVGSFIGMDVASGVGVGSCVGLSSMWS
jgi:hypothetical protein